MKLKVKEETHPVLADIFIGAAMSSLERMMDEVGTIISAWLLTLFVLKNTH